MVILDTDHLTVIQRQSEPSFSFVSAGLSRTPPSEIYTTIINVEEQMRGWLAVISRANKPPQQIAAYLRLHALFSFFAATPVLDFDQSAANIFAQLRRSRIRFGSMDLKIAAIALSRDATLLSRNLIDFRRIPGLKIEDWTQGE